MAGIVRFPPVVRARLASGLRRVNRRLVPLLVLVVGIAVFTVGLAAHLVGGRKGDLVVGAVQDPRTSSPGIVADAPPAELPIDQVSRPEDDGPGIVAADGSGGPAAAVPPTGRRLLDANGRPYGAPIPFNASIPVPAGLVWVLLIGSDARPGEQPLRTRADSIHLLAANPATGQATILGFPRDSFVEIPGHGTGKINSALALGGPELLAGTINRFTGLPVQYWVAAGFAAFQSVIDEVGGIDVEVPLMDDLNSGAHFSPGFHHFDGAQALAFSRNRHQFADGDLSRSRNQGVVILAALAKLRNEVGDEAGLRGWLGIAFRHLSLGVNSDQALQLLAVARRTDPHDVTNLVLQGRGGMSGSQSVVYLDAQAAARVADDVRPDAAIGPAKGPSPTATVPPSTTTSSSTMTLPVPIP